MAIDSDREELRERVEEKVYSEFLRLMREPEITEDEWRYIAIGCAMRLLGGASISLRSECMAADMKAIMDKKKP